MLKFILIILFPLLLFGQNNYSLQYDGGDYINKTTANWRNADQSGAVSFWFKFGAAGAVNQCVFGSCDNGSATKFFSLGISDDERINILQRNADDVDEVEGSTVLDAGTWYYGYIDTDGSTWKLYLNGILETPIISNGANNGDWLADVTGRDDIKMGARERSGGVEHYWTGHIDEIAYFSTSDLTRANTIYNNGRPNDLTGMAGLVSYWRFETGSGTAALDGIGSDNLIFGAGAAAPSWSDDTPGWDAEAKYNVYNTYK